MELKKSLIFVVSDLGDKVLYYSFDTLDNLITMEGMQQANFDPRVEDRTGQVDARSFIYIPV